jgi:pimeloyl-ACP methyl ester carboxylesterase
MGTYVLVHGGWHGAWCWSRIIPLLEQAGHRAIALDLPGCGRDKTPSASLTLKDYVDAVVRELDALPEPANLIGHSSGGVVVTQVAEARPDKIRSLVYLSALVPQNGESIMSLFQQATESTLLRSVVPSADQAYLTIPDAAVKACFYELCPPEYVTLARLCLVPQPISPGLTPVATTEKNAGRVPRVYIETLRDRAIPHAFQKRMHTTTPCRKVHTLDTDHSPFFSAPEQLTELLLSV